MKKPELIARLRQRLLTGGKNKSEDPFVKFFIDYLTLLVITHDEKYDHWHIDHYLPQIVADAYELLRTSEEEWVVMYRLNYEKLTEHEVPNLLEIGATDGIYRAIVAETLGWLFKEVVGHDHMKDVFDEYLNAQSNALMGTFDKFLRQVFRRGLYDLIEGKDARGMSGKFSETDLRTYVIAGRLAFTFAKKQGEDEISVTFVAEDSDPNAYSAGIQSVYATLPECMVMIEDVIRLWPSDKVVQAQVFGDNAAVKLDAVAYMEAAARQEAEQTAE
ncbi:MAG TPA: hypothetical protein VK254_00230 [Candidatus Bathyarchaeia archaeon]|nr:hypothetical protein [Candidatus Bathyarchaeia archaeon]